MRFTFDEDQLALRDAVRTFLARECPPEDVRASWSSTDPAPTARWRALAGMGVVGLTVPERHGGMGLDETWLVLLLEEAGRAALPEPLGPVTAVAAPLFADTPAGEDWLPRIAAGDAVVVARLPGERWVESADRADAVLLGDGEDLHLVDADTLRLTAQPGFDRSRRRFSIDAQVNARTCIAAGVGPALGRAADHARLAEAARLVGAARQLVDLGTAYALEREQFGVPIGSFQAVKHQLATALVRIEFARPAVYRAAWSMATRDPERSQHVAMAHRLAAQSAHLAGRTALQVHGAIGYTDEHDLHLWLRLALNPAAA
jgi:alkylation response protein AidB-like acyl-CoA dehydrogenase